ncbi:hypothetical protein BY996DRAFT_6422243 [Phakopsora pachyrhizi]|nr:hypothetical protein BY996DRAFT_6422243 [Phakopsora pachyrhizi]
MFEFACFLLEVVKELGGEDKEEKKSSEKLQSSHTEEQQKRKDNDMEKMDLMHEAILLLQKLANCRHVSTETINLALGSPELKGASDFPDVGLSIQKFPSCLWSQGYWVRLVESLSSKLLAVTFKTIMDLKDFSSYISRISNTLLIDQPSILLRENIKKYLKLFKSSKLALPLH